jgi:hypothetical protein
MKRRILGRMVAAAVVAATGVAVAPTPASAAAGYIDVFVDESFRGPGYRITGAVRDLTPHGINDKITSTQTRNGGCFVGFVDADFRGAWIRFDAPYDDPNLGTYGFNDKISSIKPC